MAVNAASASRSQQQSCLQLSSSASGFSAAKQHDLISMCLSTLQHHMRALLKGKHQVCAVHEVEAQLLGGRSGLTATLLWTAAGSCKAAQSKQPCSCVLHTAGSKHSACDAADTALSAPHRAVSQLDLGCRHSTDRRLACRAAACRPAHASCQPSNPVSTSRAIAAHWEQTW